MAALTEAERIALARGRRGGRGAGPRGARATSTSCGRATTVPSGWLDQVLAVHEPSPSTRAKAMTYLGSVASDRADYPRAVALLEDATAPLTRLRGAASRGVRAVDAGPDRPAAR